MNKIWVAFVAMLLGLGVSAHATISGVYVTQKTASSITVQWSSDLQEDYDSVNYSSQTAGVCGTFVNATSSAACGYSHTYVLTGLRSGTTYCIQPHGVRCLSGVTDTGGTVTGKTLPTATATPTITVTYTVTPTKTLTNSPTLTATISPTFSITNTFTPTATITVTATSTPSPTSTVTPATANITYGYTTERFFLVAASGASTVTFTTQIKQAGDGDFLTAYALDSTHAAYKQAYSTLTADSTTAAADGVMAVYWTGPTQIGVYVPSGTFTSGDNVILVVSHLIAY